MLEYIVRSTFLPSMSTALMPSSTEVIEVAPPLSLSAGAAAIMPPLLNCAVAAAARPGRELLARERRQVSGTNQNRILCCEVCRRFTNPTFAAMAGPWKATVPPSTDAITAGSNSLCIAKLCRNRLLYFSFIPTINLPGRESLYVVEKNKKTLLFTSGRIYDARTMECMRGV